jgi:putative peptidoglycan lipid II flippase
MLLPALSAHAASGRDEAAGALMGRAIRVALVFAVPLAALTMALAQPLTTVVLERGAFTTSSTALTATAIAWYAPAAIALAIMQLLYRVYQARQALWSLATFAGAALMLRGLPGLALLPGARALAGLGLAGVAAFAAAWFARSAFVDGAALALVGGGAAGLAAYAGVLFAVAPSEARTVLAVLAPAVSGRPA